LSDLGFSAMLKRKGGRIMEYSIAIPIFVFVFYGMIFLVQKFLEKVDPSIEEIDMSRVIPYLVISAVIIAIKYFTSK
jgi:hypothetical protein